MLDKEVSKELLIKKMFFFPLSGKQSDYVTNSEILSHSTISEVVNKENK